MKKIYKTDYENNRDKILWLNTLEFNIPKEKKPYSILGDFLKRRYGKQIITAILNEQADIKNQDN